MAYEFIQEGSLNGSVIDTETNEMVCLVDTKRPDMEFGSLKELIDKANMYDDLCK